MSSDYRTYHVFISSWLLVIVVSLGSFPAQSQTISADLTFRVACKEEGQGLSDEHWSAFLAQRGFTVLDKVRLAHERGQKALLPRDLVALDAQDRIVELKQLPVGSPYQYVALRSRPPTQHDADLEAALISFASEAPGCRAVEIARHDNNAGLRSFHDRLATMAKGWFRSQKGI